MSGAGLPGANSLSGLCHEQFGVLSREQALSCGMSRGAVRHRLRPGGPWQVMVPGVYLTMTGIAAPDQRNMAALLHAGPSSVLTGPAALRRYGLQVPPQGPVDVLVPACTRRVSSGFIQVHRTGTMPEEPWVTGAIRSAPVPRAVADAARMLADLADVRAVVAWAIQRGRCTLPALAAELEQGPSRGSGLLRRTLGEVAEGIRSAAEGDLLDLIKRARLPRPMLNARLLADGRLLAIVDAWWPGAGVAVEVPRQLRREAGAVAGKIRSALSAPGRGPLPVRALPAA